MKKLIEIINEGVHDQGIFKAIFFVGGPGAGKNYLIQKIFNVSKSNQISHSGLKLIDPDIPFEYLLKRDNISMDSEKSKDNFFIKRKVAKSSSLLMYRLSLFNRQGLILAATGRKFEKILNMKKYLEKHLGYNTMVVFIDSSLETSLSRNKKRDRKLPDEFVRNFWLDVQHNKEKLKALFGNNFISIESSEPNLGPIKSKIDKFIKSPINTTKSRIWISKELNKHNHL